MNEASKENLVLTYRAATANDATDILAILEEVAPEVPVLLDTPDRVDKIKTVIIQCYQSGESWVACDAAGEIVGFALAKPDVLERFHNRNHALSLPYIGVSKTSRKHGIFAVLMDKLKSKGVPLTASVLHGNQSGMADRLVKIGFTKGQVGSKETKFRWDPVAPVSGH